MPSAAMLLWDPLLQTLASGLDDIENSRIAQGNRYRILTRTEADTDGETRGFGLTEDHPAVAALAMQLETLQSLEAAMTKALSKQLRQHPLHPWIKAQVGLGDKQVARLLSTVGDPYWNDLHERPRTVSELWAFCGLHVLPDGTAPARRRGQKANWNAEARKRIYVIAESCIKKRQSPYRPVYDTGREKYADALHERDCVRCGPSGKPAPAGSPLSAGHQHGRAMRLVMKEVLKDLWRESKSIYEQAGTQA